MSRRSELSPEEEDLPVLQVDELSTYRPWELDQGINQDFMEAECTTVTLGDYEAVPIPAQSSTGMFKEATTCFTQNLF